MKKMFGMFGWFKRPNLFVSLSSDEGASPEVLMAADDVNPSEKIAPNVVAIPPIETRKNVFPFVILTGWAFAGVLGFIIWQFETQSFVGKFMHIIGF